MQLHVSRSKNAESFYIIKGYRDRETGKATSKVVERLGARAELEARLGAGTDIAAWGRARARELTEAEQASSRKVAVEYDPSRPLEAGARRVFNGGYLFLQRIYHELGLDEACRQVASARAFSYDLDAILSRLVYGRILSPASKASTAGFAHTLIEPPAFETHQVYRALGALAGGCDAIQAALYKGSARLGKRATRALYYDCTNYYFEIEQEDALRRYGPSKQHQPSPLVQMGLFMDADGMPLAFCIDHGAKNEQLTMRPLEQRVIDDFGLSEFVVVTDAGLSSLANRRFNSEGRRHFITTQSVKCLKGHLRAWALEEGGWQAPGSDAVFDLAEVAARLDGGGLGDGERAQVRDRVFYKSRRIKERDPVTKGYFEQTLVVTFSFKYRDYQRSVRQGQAERAAKAIAEGPSRLERKGRNDYRRLIKRTAVTGDGEVAECAAYAIDEAAIAKEACYDGFYALATSFDDDDVPGILKASQRRWEIEECFRIMKTEFKARPVYLSRADRIEAHFLTCFIALAVYRVLEARLGGRFTVRQVIDTLKGMDFEEVKGEGYRPLYQRTEVTDALHDAFGFRTDFEIIPDRDMKRIIRLTKKR